MRTLFAFLKDLYRALTSPGAPWPDQACSRFVRRGH
jgi:hypothetical protein